jgi:hypothetical protein
LRDQSACARGTSVQRTSKPPLAPV